MSGIAVLAKSRRRERSRLEKINQIDETLVENADVIGSIKGQTFAPAVTGWKIQSGRPHPAGVIFGVRQPV